MDRPPITIVIARAKNGVIGCDNKLPWSLPADLRRFKELTMGTAMVMGRRTFESLPKLLPGRQHIVLTRNQAWHVAGTDVAHSVEEAIALAKGAPISVIGGAEIFDLFLNLADRIELTVIEALPRGDASIRDPRKVHHDWHQRRLVTQQAESGRPAYSFWSLERRQLDLQRAMIRSAAC